MKPKAVGFDASWIDDYCEEGYGVDSRRHAEGLLTLHRECDPPCPRWHAARWYLATHPPVANRHAQ